MREGGRASNGGKSQMQRGAAEEPETDAEKFRFVAMGRVRVFAFEI